ncbi:hypothetical protein UA08_04977 [Talaromyces atroroseus]|uniref:Efflux pump dotC n=1 Tax=Talaromyces atroroseus TaxID=1441469 RepID=A0A225AXW3_TALAT|nr:hypothetical protein UA08_04977 [Talaromyces atroroseus]OKL59816.1 hypothetical protein UA08_04977 [Talaromyces atroroseus]
MADTDASTEANLNRSEEGLIKNEAETPEYAVNAGDDVADEQLTKAQALLLVCALGLSTFIAALEQTIISTASPTISRSFHTSELDFTWIGTAYLLSAAASTPPWGKISDIFGRKPILMVTIIVFWIGSLIGALSVNINMLIAARVLQGIGGGGILGLSATIIGDVFSPRERSKYFGVLGVVWGMACGLGPIIGGAFCQYVNWRWCFWINLPVAGVAGVLCLLFLKVESPRTPIWEGLRAMDWLGTTLIAGATVMFLLGLGYGGVTYPWHSAIVISLIVFGIVTLFVYTLVEWKIAKYPITPLRLFKSISNVATFGIAYLHGAVYIANFYYLPLYFQAVLGASPILSGVYLLPVAVTLCVASTLTGVYISKTGRYRPPIYFGLIMMILGDGLYTDLQPYTSWSRIIFFQIIAGVGLGPLFQAPIIAVFSLTKAADIASSAATVFFMRDIATAMSIVFGGVIFENRINAHASEIDAAVPASLAAQIAGGDATSVTDDIRALSADARTVVAEVYTKALQDEWIFYTALSAGALVLSVLISKQVLSREHKINKQGLDVQEASRLEELIMANGDKTDTTSA